MKITICGSLQFAKEILEIEKTLQNMGHETLIPLWTEQFINWLSNNRNEWSFDFARAWMLGHYDNISKSDAIVVANFDKNGIKWYIGWAVLIEMWVACHLKKKIFVLHDIPSADEIRYIQEVTLMQPTIINNDLSLIK